MDRRQLPHTQSPNPARRSAVLALSLGVWVVGFGVVASAQLTREEALGAVYPGASIRAEQVFLTPAQQKQVITESDADVASALIARYVATKDGAVIGRAYVDTHIVRTKKESLLIALDSKGQVLRIDVTAFNEPPEYRASDAWLRQYRGKPLTDDLEINRAIRPIAGATLTARETNKAVRRVLAVDAVLQNGGSAR
jgi:electron transport complex protein RnfG